MHATLLAGARKRKTRSREVCAHTHGGSWHLAMVIAKWVTRNNGESIGLSGRKTPGVVSTISCGYTELPPAIEYRKTSLPFFLLILYSVFDYIQLER